ncbi:MAG TPA: GH92 family glycosyl hydrolase [Chitinophagaceae bacterium]|nr:GH92 family glycosyl hydrolase [Chitinophagaceae bacterium]
MTFDLAAQKDYSGLVNTFIGTGGHGHTYPGASMPFGMMQLSPDTRLEGWDGCGGYHYSDNKIYGFSHTHLSGTGIPDYCDILFMPFTGNVQWDNKDYASTFSHANEKASPGYYEVLLDKHNIKAQLAVSYRSGMHQYTFPSSASTGSILIDLRHRDQVLEAHWEKVSDTEIKGYRKSRSWAREQTVYFYVQFEKPVTFSMDGGYSSGSPITSATGKDIHVYFSFDLDKEKTIRTKVGISGVSMEGAKLNLDMEIKDWDFEKLRSNATTAWNKELSKIEVKGGTEDQQTVFYSALYHTMLSPNIYTDVDGRYRGTDLKVHKAENFTNYTVFSLWDTYRAFHPLMTIIDQKRTTDWINTFLAQYKNGGMLPVWELSGNETFCMIGYHSVPGIADAYQKGIRGFDSKLALEAMLSYAESERYGLHHYAANGFLSNEKEHESVSKTMEYAYDDWCIAQFAKMTGENETYKKYIERAQFYKNLYDPSTSHMRGKVQAMWYTPFDAKEINNFYTEGNSWHYSFAAPQDIEGLIKLMGGKQKFGAKLNQLFTTTSKLTGRDQSDVTGLIGQYAQGNEPSHHMAYLFSYAGMPWRTEELVNKICTEFYTNSPDGLIGNEDCGQMSAWFVLSSMGFYPVCPGDGKYILGTPLFDEVKINLENGRTFTINADKKGTKNFYVRDLKLNGRPYSPLFLQHSDIMTGGSLSFRMGALPVKTRGINKADIPVSAISEDKIVPVPYFDISSNKFKKQVSIRLRSVEPGAQIYYRIMRPNIRSVFVPYKGPFVIAENTQIDAYAEKAGVQSKTVSQQFYRIAGDKSIKVLSKVHPMYTAGGPEALIDGLTGTTNWRTGEWQSYFDTDFEAVIDLQTIKPISYLGVHVLQDVSPWIVYPKEIIFEASNDGKRFTEIARVKNIVGAEENKVMLQELGTAVNTKARYIKVKAINGGKLPAWHESAGNPSHLFIDEIILK